MRYRQATPASAAAIAHLHAESWRATYRGAYRDDYLDGPVFADRRDVWAERFANPAPNQFVIVADDGDRLAGFACAYGADHPKLGALLDNLHVLAPWRGTGTGKRLLLEVARWAHEHYPHIGLYLGVLEQNTHAQEFYRRLGARDAGGEAFSPPGGGETRGRIYVWTAGQVAELARLARGGGRS